MSAPFFSYYRRRRLILLYLGLGGIWGLAAPVAHAAPPGAIQAGTMKIGMAPWEEWMAPIARREAYEQALQAAQITAEAVEDGVCIHLRTGAPQPATPLAIHVKFRLLWPGYEYDVAVQDEQGNYLPARRRTDLPDELIFWTSPERDIYYVRAQNPHAGLPPLPAETERTVKEPTTGLKATICRWPEGRQAAISFRFDDSYPSHILSAIPLLRQFGFQGTFFIIPGAAEYLAYKNAWEACARQGDQEFANHTMHHYGATNDEETEREIGEATAYIRQLFPQAGLICFSPGGGTIWTHSRPLRYFLDKYRLIIPRPQLALSMTENSAPDFQMLLEQAIEKQAWLLALFHQIQKPWLSEETFRAVLEMTRARQEMLWIAGMARVYKYQQARQHARLTLEKIAERAVKLTLSCATDPLLFDEPLTIELTLPEKWPPSDVTIRSEKGERVPFHIQGNNVPSPIRFSARAISAAYIISREP